MSKRVHPCPDLETTDLVTTSEQRTKNVNFLFLKNQGLKDSGSDTLN